MSTLGGRTIAKLHELVIPPGGGWLADLTLESGAAPTVGTRLDLVVADLTLSAGLVLRSGLDAPDQPRATVAGGGGWRTLLTGASYYSPGGVRLSTVLRDLAAVAGEPYDAPTEAILGKAWGWAGSTPRAPVDARAALSALRAHGAIRGWRVATSGRTRFDAWPAGADVTSLGRVVARDQSRGVRRVELDSRLAPFLPGARIEGATIRRVIVREVPGLLAVEAWES